jgi:hypothetical protein
MVSLERLYCSLSGKINTAEQWEDKQHVKALLREENGMVWARKQPNTTSDGVKAVKKGDKTPIMYRSSYFYHTTVAAAR